MPCLQFMRKSKSSYCECLYRLEARSMDFSRSQGSLTRILTQILRFQDADFPLSKRIKTCLRNFRMKFSFMV